MMLAVANPSPMAKKAGRPKKNAEMTGIRISKESNDLAREAGGITGESIVAYVDRIVRERAKADILEHARRRVLELEGPTSAEKPKS